MHKLGMTELDLVWLIVKEVFPYVVGLVGLALLVIWKVYS